MKNEPIVIERELKLSNVITSQPPSDEFCKANGLLYHDGQPMLPAFCGAIEVWASAINEDTPKYAMYCRGTNDLRIFKTEGDSWVRVKEVPPDLVYGLIWRLCSEILQQRYDLKCGLSKELGFAPPVKP